MGFLNYQGYPVWLNLIIFLAAAVFIWFAGIRLERCADTLAARTGLGQAFTGMLLLAGATSLPEVATSITAARIPNPELAVNNLLGSVLLQTVVLALADWWKRDRGALTYFSPHYVLLIEGVGLVLVLQVALAGAAARSLASIWGIGMDTILILVVYLLLMYLTYRAQRNPRWQPTPRDSHRPALPKSQETESSGGEALAERDPEGGDCRRPDCHPGLPLARVYGQFAAAAGIVLAAGWTVARAGDALATQTGLGSTLVGATLLAFSTSLPEISTTIAATRRGNYSMAFSNIFGSNSFTVALLFVADVFYRKEPILRHTSPSVLFLAAWGGVVTCVYLWGLLEREDRSVFGRIGWDSAAVGVLYLIGLAILYAIQ